jgi:hypothetical protein
MARRAGKAASRKARQRKSQQRSATRPASPPASSAASVPSVDASAFDAAATTVGPVATSPERTSSRAAAVRTPRRTASASAGFGSTLTDTERSEYHYVERDLREIGILTAAMIGLLIVAWLVFTATGHVV